MYYFSCLQYWEFHSSSHHLFIYLCIYLLSETSCVSSIHFLVTWTWVVPNYLLKTLSDINSYHTLVTVQPGQAPSPPRVNNRCGIWRVLVRHQLSIWPLVRQPADCTTAANHKRPSHAHTRARGGRVLGLVLAGWLFERWADLTCVWFTAGLLPSHFSAK